MSADSLIVERQARKNLLKLPPKIHTRIVNAFRVIKENPLIGEKLHGALKGYYKLRLGDYRIVYSLDTKKSLVTVVKIEHRQGVYR